MSPKGRKAEWSLNRASTQPASVPRTAVDCMDAHPTASPLSLAGAYRDQMLRKRGEILDLELQMESVRGQFVSEMTKAGWKRFEYCSIYCPSERANDSVAKLKRELRRTLRRRLKAINDHGQALVAGTYWF